MRYVIERYRQEQRELAYRIYVTDSIRALLGNPENRRFADFLEEMDHPGPAKEEKSAEEIISAIKGKLVSANGDNGV